MISINQSSSQINDYFNQELDKVDSNDSYLRHWLEILRDYPKAVANLRLRKSKANLFAVNVMRDAIRFQFTEAVLAIAVELPSFQIYKGHTNQLESYYNIISRYQKIYSAEIIAKTYSAKISKDFLRKMQSHKLVSKLDKILCELEGLANEVNSFTFQMFYYELRIRRFQLLKDENGILQTCMEAVKKFEEKRVKISPKVLFAFTYPQLPILIQNEKFEIVKTLIKKWNRILRAKDNDWFVVNSYNVILNFRMQNYAKVRRLLSKIDSYPTELIKERYFIYEAYLALFTNKKINVARFINDVYEHQKDKEGYNVPIKIAELIHLLKIGDDKSKARYIESIGAVKLYMYRHLKDDKRSLLFFKMLLTIPQCDFSFEKYKIKTERYLSELQNLPIERYSPSVEVELIPYEVLNEEVKKYLK